MTTAELASVPPVLHPAPAAGAARDDLDSRRVARAISLLVESYREQPSLAEVAGSVGLSPWHFDRVFRRLTGVTPKRFVQCLTLEHAKRRLAADDSVLEAALDAGLSGPGRLHDLFVAVEAVTPGEFKRGGAGVRIGWGVHPTPFGDALLAATDRGLCAFAFLAEPGGDGAAEARAVLRRAWPAAETRHDPEAVRPAAERIAAALGAGGSAGAADEPIPLHLRGTNFQLQVWRALLALAPGETVSYGELAQRLGRPTAARAVAGAVAANPVAWLIPCHRVLRASGALGGYRWGTARKRALLAWEAARG